VSIRTSNVLATSGDLGFDVIRNHTLLHQHEGLLVTKCAMKADHLVCKASDSILELRKLTAKIYAAANPTNQKRVDHVYLHQKRQNTVAAATAALPGHAVGQVT